MTEADWAPLIAARTVPTRRGVLQGLFAAVLYLAGANVGAGWVVVLSAALGGAVLAAWVSARWAAHHAAVRRRLPARMVADAPCEALLDVRAPGSGRLAVLDDLTAVAGALASGETLTAPVRPPRGAIEGDRVRVVIADRFGLMRSAAEGYVPSTALAVPAVGEGGALLPAGAPLGGSDQAVRARSGVEFAGLRAYAPGDPPRTVRWRASARHGRLVVGEPLRPTAPVLRVAIAGGTWTRPALDRATVRACGLAAAAAAEGRTVEIAADGRVQPWSDAARQDLALLPPHAGAAARALAPPPGAAVETVLVTPGGVS
jgi:uncharacterized protein (DUF58 family)